MPAAGEAAMRYRAVSTILVLGAVRGLAAPFSLGYVSHFPLIRHDDDQVPAAGVNVMLVRVPWALIEPEPGKFEFGLLDEQLEWAARIGVPLIWVLEAGPAHAAGVAWLMEALKQAGEWQGTAGGGQVAAPSIFSPLYRRHLDNYVQHVVSYLRGHRLAQWVYGYGNGCEWWMPLEHCYGPLEVREFRGWAVARHGGLDGLNRAWGTQYKTAEEISPPELVSDGMATTLQGRLSPRRAIADLCYASTPENQFAVSPGQTVRFEAEFDLRECKTGGVKLEIAWLRDDAPQLLSISPSEMCSEDGAGLRLTVEATAPAGATKAWVLAKLLGVGRACFRRLTVRIDGQEVGANAQLDPRQGGWRFISWSAGDPEGVKATWEKPGEACLAYAPPAPSEEKAERPLAKVWDWMDFRAMELAGFMDWFAERIKSVDPSRPVITYTTMSFANPFEWDYVEQMAVELDKVAGQRHHDVIGMQLASAAGDADSVAAAFDMVRKTGKPMWAVDLLDFSLGVGGGEELLTRTSLAAVQHGAAGILYYCWYGTPVYNYTDLGISALRRMAEAVRTAAEAVEGMSPEVSVALVMPRMPLYAFLPEPANDWRDFMGWYKLLRRMGVGVDVYTLGEARSLKAGGYRAVVVPDCAYLPRAAAQALGRCAEAGAALVTSGRFARRDETGEILPARLRPKPSYAFDEAVGARLLGECWRHPSPTDTPPRLTTRGSPDWASERAQEVVQRLSALGVRVVKDPAAPFFVRVFRGKAGRRALVVPDGNQAGQARIEGVEAEVSPPWKVLDLPRR